MEKDFCNVKWTQTDEGFMIEFMEFEFKEFFNNWKKGDFNCCSFDKGAQQGKKRGGHHEFSEPKFFS
jgi:hypothetical protein